MKGAVKVTSIPTRTYLPLLWHLLQAHWTSLLAQTVKRLPTVRETQVRSLGWEDPWEKEMATHSSTLAWKIPWMENPGRLQSTGSQRVDTTDFPFTLQAHNQQEMNVRAP